MFRGCFTGEAVIGRNAFLRVCMNILTLLNIDAFTLWN